MNSARTTSKLAGWILVFIGYLAGALGILFSLGVGYLALFNPEAKPDARNGTIIFLGLIFAVSVFCIVMAARKAKQMRSS